MQVRISRPAKSATQSGTRKEEWLLEFVERPGSKFKEPLMGRTASNDMASEVKIKFSNLESAIEFARTKNYDFEIVKPQEHRLIRKNYASNFR